MDISSKLTKWFSNFVITYHAFLDESKDYRCKIVDIETDQTGNDVILFVMINGVKKQVIPYFSKDLVVDDMMLKEFSSFDIRAITFYALQSFKPLNDHFSAYFIYAQEFLNGKTIFIIKTHHDSSEYRRAAHELYCDDKLLSMFSYNDIKNIISTAIQEQTMEDLDGLEG